MTRAPAGWDVESPVQAEILVVWRADDHLELTGPCGAAPWIVELGPTTWSADRYRLATRPTLVPSVSCLHEQAQMVALRAVQESERHACEAVLRLSCEEACEPVAAGRPVRQAGQVRLDVHDRP